MAFVDSGINPYHRDFRLAAEDDMQGVPPWEFIDGFPKTAKPIDLTLDAASYSEALAQDSWDGVKRDTLYYFPGTKIMGAYSHSGDTFRGGPVLDNESGHGTSVASVAAGSIHGITRDPDVLIVSVQGIGPGPFKWAAEQPWIDIISNSWLYTGNVYYGPLITDVHRTSKAATQAGKVVLFAAGNGASNTALACDRTLTTTSPTAGPPWVVSVGAVSPISGQDYCWHSIPPDVSSYGLHWPSAAFMSLDEEVEFGGTSAATPITAGVVAAQILEARRLLGDSREGPHGGGALAVGVEGGAPILGGPLVDRRLERQEVEDVVLKTAYPEEFDPERWRRDLQEGLDECQLQDPESCLDLTQNLTIPTTPAYYVYEGYGIVNGVVSRQVVEFESPPSLLRDRSE